MKFWLFVIIYDWIEYNMQIKQDVYVLWRSQEIVINVLRSDDSLVHFFKNWQFFKQSNKLG